MTWYITDTNMMLFYGLLGIACGLAFIMGLRQ